MITASVSIWKSYVGKGAPGPLADRRAGFGWTREAASAAAGHHARHGAFERFRRVTLFDRRGPRPARTPDAAEAWRALGYLAELTARTPTQEAAYVAMRRGNYATAWVLAGDGSEVALAV